MLSILSCCLKLPPLILKIITSFNPRRGGIAYFEETIAQLVPEASSNQFEHSMETFGKMLGFSSLFGNSYKKEGKGVFHGFE